MYIESAVLNEYFMGIILAKESISYSTVYTVNAVVSHGCVHVVPADEEPVPGDAADGARLAEGERDAGDAGVDGDAEREQAAGPAVGPQDDAQRRAARHLPVSDCCCHV